MNSQHIDLIWQFVFRWNGFYILFSTDFYNAIVGYVIFIQQCILLIFS